MAVLGSFYSIVVCTHHMMHVQLMKHWLDNSSTERIQQWQPLRTQCKQTSAITEIHQLGAFKSRATADVILHTVSLSLSLSLSPAPQCWTLYLILQFLNTQLKPAQRERRGRGYPPTSPSLVHCWCAVCQVGLDTGGGGGRRYIYMCVRVT